MRQTGRITKLTEEEEAARFAKLPKWAQSHIRSLEQDLASKVGRIEELSTQHPDTNVKVNGRLTDPDYELPADSQIEFTMGDPAEAKTWRDKISVGHIRGDKKRTVLRIQGDNSIVIRPSGGSNCIEVTLDD